MDTSDTFFTLVNGRVELTINSYGGALRAFRMSDCDVNPLSFSLPPQYEGQQGGFQGHFVCLGRWGDPTAGERTNGLLKHGDSCRLPWTCEMAPGGSDAVMAVTSDLEGLGLQRHVKLCPDSTVVQVAETVTNLRPQGRFYQLVQHPTFAAPFLDRDTLIFCNAGPGFDQAHNVNPEANALHWPYVYRENESIARLNRFDEPCDGVFSFAVEPGASHGWAIVYSKKLRLLIGYVWPRERYPWINIWQAWEKRKPIYLGVEFGTTGLHKPFAQVVEECQTRVFDERTYAFIDGGAQHHYTYDLFLHRLAKPLASVEYVTLINGAVRLGINGQELQLNAEMG